MADFYKQKHNLQKVAQNGQLAHAYLFIGEQGTGKKQISYWLAQYLFCQHLQNNEPCQECANCKRILEGNHPDVKFINSDTTIKVEQIQNLREEFSLTSAEGGMKFYCIEDADKMTNSSFNRLLTFLEEPPKNTYAILTTTRPDMILPTIISRCQPLYFTAQVPTLFIKTLKEHMPDLSAHFLSQMTNNLEEALELANNEQFVNQMADAKTWFDLLLAKDMRAFIFVEQHIKYHFKDKNDYMRLFEMLYILYKDYVHKHSINNQIINDLNSAKDKLAKNVNPQNVCEQLAIHILEITR